MFQHGFVSVGLHLCRVPKPGAGSLIMNFLLPVLVFSVPRYTIFSSKFHTFGCAHRTNTSTEARKDTYLSRESLA